MVSEQLVPLQGEVVSTQLVTLQSSVGVEEEDGVRRERGRKGNT